MKNKMKLSLIFLMVVCTGITLVSCHKDDSGPTVEDAPITSLFFNDNTLNIVSNGSGYYEYGFTFKVSKNGKVTKLGCKMPNSGTYRIALWDSTTNTVLASQTINANAASLKLDDISPVSLVTGKTYLITIFSGTAWYEIRKNDDSDFVYPIKKGSLSLLGYYWISSASGNDPIFPENYANFYVAGLPDLTFQPD